MELTIKDQTFTVAFGVGVFAKISEYKKHYEPHLNMSLHKYMQLVQSGEYMLDVICDVIFYPYAIQRRNNGLPVKIEYSDVFEYLISNPEKLEAISEQFAGSMPKVEEADMQKKTRAKAKN